VLNGVVIGGGRMVVVFALFLRVFYQLDLDLDTTFSLELLFVGVLGVDVLFLKIVFDVLCFFLESFRCLFRRLG
jgi:hypothetical protein